MAHTRTRVEAASYPRRRKKTRSVLIFGTDHKYQSRDPVLHESQHEQFTAYLTRLVKQHGVKHLAEEYSTQALEEQGSSETTVETLANRLGLAHSYCDLDRNTRYSLGIFQECDIRLEGFRKGWAEEEIGEKIRQSHRARERFWLERLLVTELWPVLFVCGADHASHFADLLRSKGFDASVIEEQWGTP